MGKIRHSQNLTDLIGFKCIYFDLLTHALEGLIRKKARLTQVQKSRYVVFRGLSVDDMDSTWLIWATHQCFSLASRITIGPIIICRGRWEGWSFLCCQYHFNYFYLLNFLSQQSPSTEFTSSVPLHGSYLKLLLWRCF